MTTTNSQDDEMRAYSKAHLLQHMRERGKTNDEIAQAIAFIPDDNPDKDHYIQQFLNSLSPEEKENFAQRLRSSSD
ncbi:MAG: hypothetical protein U0525_05465 [Patescibacteria group bacterium]